VVIDTPAGSRNKLRVLSAARDDTVLLMTLGELTGQTQGSGKRRSLNEFRAGLQRQANHKRSELARRGLRQSAARLRGALTMVDSWPTPLAEWKPVYRGLRDSYRKGRRCARCNAQRASGPALHEWRKRAKYLRNQLGLIAPMQHASVEAMPSELHRLSDHLGAEHDPAVLGELVHRSGRQLGRKADSALQKLIDKGRRKDAQACPAVGLPIYAEKPGHFETRLRHYFRAWS
jgi:CHAD domain-containing protein